MSYVQIVNLKQVVKLIYKMMQFKFFVGIDVSKDTLDFSVVSGGVEIKFFQIENSCRAVKVAVKELKNIKGLLLDQTLFCVEQTGIYNNHLTYTLHSLKQNIWVEKAIQIKRSSGLQRGKSDKVDARRIAMYAFRNADAARLWTAPRAVLLKLKRLTAARHRLIKMVGQLSKPIQESKRFDSRDVYQTIKQTCESSLKALKAGIKKTDRQILELIKADSTLKHLFELATSVTGIGKVIACEMIITTNEFKNITDHKKYACYAGVVPFEHSSGSSVRGKTRVSHFANKEIKRLLHMAAMSVVRYKSDLKTYWLRKLEEGKHKMVVLNAIRNKLIERVFAVVKRGSKFEKIYTNPLTRS